MSCYPTLRYLLLTLAMTTLCPASMQATAPPDSTVRDSRLKEVNIHGKSALRAIDATIPKQTVSSDEMATFGYANISDVLKHMTGVTLRDYGGAGGMKTASIRGLGAQFTAVNYDGAAVSNIQTGQIDLQRYTLNGISTITLQTGDGSDIFVTARNATLPSLIDITTQMRSDTSFHINAQATLGAWGYTNPAIKADKGFGRLNLSVTMDYLYAENDYPFTIYNISERIHKRRTHSLMNQGHAEISASYKFNDRQRLSVKTYYYDNDRQLPGIVRYYTSESKQNLRERNTFVHIKYHGQLGKQWQVKSTAKWDWASSDYRDHLYQDHIMDAKYWQREGYLSNAALWKPHQDWAFSCATDYIFNSLNSCSATTLNQRPCRHSVLNTVSARWNGGFIYASARLLNSNYINKTHVGASGRNYHRWTPSASLSLKPAKDINLRLMWKKIFRMPSFSDLYYYHLGAKNLRPEQTAMWNIGIATARRLDKHTTAAFSIDGYYNKITDKIVSVPINLFIWQNINASKVIVKGTDITASLSHDISPDHRITIRGQYSYQHATDRSSKTSATYNRQIAYQPLHTFSLTMSWENPWANISIDSNGQSAKWSTSAHSEGTRIAGYAEFGLTASKTVKPKFCEEIRFSMTISNILNKQYEIIAHYPMPGRSWRTTIACSF